MKILVPPNTQATVYLPKGRTLEWEGEAMPDLPEENRFSLISGQYGFVLFDQPLEEKLS